MHSMLISLNLLHSFKSFICTLYFVFITLYNVQTLFTALYTYDIINKIVIFLFIFSYWECNENFLITVAMFYFAVRIVTLKYLFRIICRILLSWLLSSPNHSSLIIFSPLFSSFLISSPLIPFFPLFSSLLLSSPLFSSLTLYPHLLSSNPLSLLSSPLISSPLFSSPLL